jgi:tetraacyldisaccharide 4'-kinase
LFVVGCQPSLPTADYRLKTSMPSMGFPTNDMLALHRHIISPDSGGLLTGLARLGLCVPAGAYGAVALLRNRLYDRGWRRRHDAGLPVISIGNISAGGTGKTPLVAWLARQLLHAGLHPGVLSRGYGARHGGPDDENQMLGRLLPGVPIVVNPDRVAGAAEARSRHQPHVLLLDDGFQHRRIARDLDIVVLDALQPFGGGWMLPRGLLREPAAGLRRADFIVLNRALVAGQESVQAVRSRLSSLAPGVPVACCDMELRALRPLWADTPEHVVEDLAHGRWAAFCGIGNPEGFLKNLQAAGCDLARFAALPDHYEYSAPEVGQILADARREHCCGVLATEKDAAKLEHLLHEQPVPPLYAVQSELVFTHGEAALREAAVRTARS